MVGRTEYIWIAARLAFFVAPVGNTAVVVGLIRLISTVYSKFSFSVWG